MLATPDCEEGEAEVRPEVRLQNRELLELTRAGCGLTHPHFPHLGNDSIGSQNTSLKEPML